MKRAVVFVIAMVAGSCSSEIASAQVLHVKCEGIYHYTGLIGTTGQFTTSEFFDDAEYVFDLTKEEVGIVSLGKQSPFCSPSNDCQFNFGDRLITVIRHENWKGQQSKTSFAFDRETMQLRLTSSGSGYLRQNELVCAEVVRR